MLEAIAIDDGRIFRLELDGTYIGQFRAEHAEFQPKGAFGQVMVTIEGPDHEPIAFLWIDCIRG